MTAGLPTLDALRQAHRDHIAAARACQQQAETHRQRAEHLRRLIAERTGTPAATRWVRPAITICDDMPVTVACPEDAS